VQVFKHPIGEIVVSDEVWNRRFSCDLKRCRGSCCVIGDLGAGLLPEEEGRLKGFLPGILPLLSEKNRKFLAQGISEVYHGRIHIREVGRNVPCPFGIFEGNDILLCSLHRFSQESGNPLETMKPFWCQFYPLILVDTPSGCIINLFEGEFCRSIENAPPILMAFGRTIEKLLGKPFIDEVRERYSREGWIS